MGGGRHYLPPPSHTSILLLLSCYIIGSNAISYGAVPNNPKTWDALKIFGCLCDSGYMGYDCSLRVCPFGDDPDTATVSVHSCTVSSLFSFFLSFSHTYSPTLSMPLITHSKSTSSKSSLARSHQTISKGHKSLSFTRSPKGPPFPSNLVVLHLPPLQISRPTSSQSPA